MAFLEEFGLSEGLQVFLLAFALLMALFFLLRYLSFYSAYRKVRKENLELAAGIKKRLKTAKLRSLDEIMDEQDDEMFRKGFEGDKSRLPRESGKAKPLVIPATYEARVSKARSEALKRKPRQKAGARRKKSR